MPKAKKIRAPSLTSKQVRHEPLGQAIESDAIREKYAPPVRARRKKNNVEEADSEYLDEKTSKKILDMTRSQQLEMEAEEEGDALRRSIRKNPSEYDSEDEEEELEEIIFDEGEE